MSAAPIALVACGVLLLGSCLALLPRGLRVATAGQAAGLGALGIASGFVLLNRDTLGAAFTDGLHPALGLDPLSAFFLIVLAIVGVPALIYMPGYLQVAAGKRGIACLTGLFITSLVLVVTARDVTTFLAGWELMTLIPAAVILVARSDRLARRAAFVYLAVTHLGGVGVWIALLTLSQLGAMAGHGALLTIAPAGQLAILAAALIGFGTKAGLMPMHSWLPRAHPAAPSHVSALMSGVMVKVAIYGLIRALGWAGGHATELGIALLALGILSSVGGVLYAIFQHELKRLLAFHSIENVGIIALALGASMLLAGAGQPYWSAIAFAAALFHVLNHAVFKALLFMSAGAIERAAHVEDLDHAGGLLARMPWTGGCFLIGSAAIAGLPPLNGFVSEWLTLQALIHGAMLPSLTGLASALAAVALGATAALAVLCFVKVVGLVLLGQPRNPAAAKAQEVGYAMRLSMAALAALCIVLGALPAPVLSMLLAIHAPQGSNSSSLTVTLPGTGVLATAPLLLFLAASMLTLARLRGGRRAASAPVWTCGQPVEPGLAWTSSGFSKALRLSWEWIIRPQREITVDRQPGVILAARYEGHVPHLFDTAFYRPVLTMALASAAKLRRLQSGSLRAYAIYLGALMALVLGLVRLGIL